MTKASSANANNTIPEFTPPAAGTCPCGSGVKPDTCCLPILQGKREAKTAEELLRARFTAFTRADVDYILNTHHTETRGEIKREEVKEWAEGSDWVGLQILQKEAGTEKDEQGTIAFRAMYREKGKDKVEEHWEQSFFKKDGGKWYFLDARGIQVGPYRRSEPKVGRNDPCPCGSGKKSKKCCAAA